MINIIQHVIMNFRITDNELLLDYERRTERCSWCIFDLNGVELCKGMLNGKAQHKIPLACLSPAHYQLCIIDGDKLLNTRFKVS